MNALPQTQSFVLWYHCYRGQNIVSVVSKVLCPAHMSHIIIILIHVALWWLSVIMLALAAGVSGCFFFFFGDFCHSFWTTPGLCLKCAHFWGLWDTCRFFLCVFVCWSLNCCRVCHHNFSISCEAAECLGVWGRPSTCALCGLPIHLTNCHSPCLLSVQFWPGFWLEHTHISRFSCSLLTEDVFVTKQNF